MRICESRLPRVRTEIGFACILSLIVLLASACGQRSSGLQEGGVAPDTVLFENGTKFLSKNQYIKARLAFQTLINTYPDSEYTPVAFYNIADSYYREAGTENLLQAEAQYKDFIIFYPTHEMADDAQMKIVAVNMRLMRAPDRDPTYARKAERELAKLLEDYPDSELAPTAREFQREVDENLAMGIEGKASFYFDRNSYLAAESRFKEVLDKYENFSRKDETLFKLARSLEELGRVEEASVYYHNLAKGFPFSEYYSRAVEKLELFEKPVPEVDQAEAERNAANYSTEGFSFMEPIKEVWQTFAGRPDPYEVARKRAEERRLAAQGQQKKDDNGGQ